MKAIETCRTAALGGHVERCQNCAHTRISYNSCRDRHCVKCRQSTAAAWLAAREGELLPVQYFHIVFTLPTALEAMAYQNKERMYGLLFKAASKSLLTLAANRKWLGAEIGITAVLHTWGGNLQHHPHLHCLIPGGGIARDGKSWLSCGSTLLPHELLAKSFRRLFLNGLIAAFEAGELRFFGDLLELNDARMFSHRIQSLRATKWVVHSKRACAGPRSILAYLARHTQAIANSRLLDLDNTHVAFICKNHQGKGGHDGAIMRLEIAEFIRRFLLHVLPVGFRRVRWPVRQCTARCQARAVSPIACRPGGVGQRSSKRYQANCPLFHRAVWVPMLRWKHENDRSFAGADRPPVSCSKTRCLVTANNPRVRRPRLQITAAQRGDVQICGMGSLPIRPTGKTLG
jgi:Putative transposase/Transposase zinc-binding domain